jgi:hypothetical protein
MAKKEWELRQFDAKSLLATRVEWLRQLEKDPKAGHKPDIEAKLDWCEKHLEYLKGPDFAYGVFAKSDNHADAIVDVVYQKDAGKKWLKAMGVTLSPAETRFFSTEPQDFENMVEIYLAAISGVLNLTKVHPTKVTKLYGRSGTLLAFLEGIAATLKTKGGLKNVSVTMEGRWLVFRAR